MSQTPSSRGGASGAGAPKNPIEAAAAPKATTGNTPASVAATGSPSESSVVVNVTGAQADLSAVNDALAKAEAAQKRAEELADTLAARQRELDQRELALLEKSAAVAPAVAERRFTPTGPAPQPGDKVWYLLRFEIPEWVRATVLDHEKAGLDEPFDPSGGEYACHLEIQLNRGRHYSSSTKGLRRDVQMGDQPGQWLRDKPKDADAVYAEAKRTKELRDAFGREQAMAKREQ